MRLVKREPGPIVIRSARAMASESLRQGLNIWGDKEQLLDAALAGGDVGFAANLRAIFHQSFEFHVGGGGGIDVSPGKQNFRGQADGFAEIAGDGGQSREKQIAEAVAFQASLR